MNLLTKQKETHRLRKKKTLWLPGDERVREFGVVRYTLIYFKWITRQRPAV